MRFLLPPIALLGPIALLTLSACTTVPAVQTPIADPLPQFSLETMKTVTKTLSSDDFGGRMPGTEGEAKTLDYLVRAFEGAGLQPGNNGSWFQDVPLVEITGKDYSPLKVTAQGRTMAFDQGSDYVAVSYRAAPATAIRDSELVFVGYGINAPERNWNDYAGLDMRGKTAVILVNDPDYETEGLDGTFNGRAMTYYGRWTYKFEEAARQGAAAALIVHDDFPAAYGWNVVESSWSGAQAYPQRRDNGMSQTMANGWVQKATAEKMLSAAGRDFAELSEAAKIPGFEPVPLGITANVSFKNDIRRYASKNVIGLLPGSERPDEYVLHTAHWDHLGTCKPNAAGDDICNGAVDNATGTAALVAMADAHKRAGPPARSLVFLAVTAEEQGLLGSDYYAANPVFPLSRTVGGVNIDALYPMAPARDVKVMGGGKSDLDAVLEQALVAENRMATPDPTPEKGYYYRSDHFSLAKRGVPMFYVEAGEDLEPGGPAAGRAFADDYTKNRYHAPDDEYSDDWDWSGIMKELRMFYRLGRIMAQGDTWPNWYEGDEFRAIRDASCTADDGGC